jgi:hypothetical protein
MLLLGKTGGGVPVQVNLHVNAQMLRRVEALGDFAEGQSQIRTQPYLLPTL